MNKDEALKMAIEALELINEHAFRCGVAQDAIKACKEALERPSNMVVVPLDKLQDMQRRLKALAQPQSVKDALEKAAVTTWSYLMDYCKKKGKNPAHDNDLFEVVNEIRALIEKE